MFSVDDASSESSASSGPEIDPEDPMAAFLLEKRREEKARKKAKKGKSKEKRKDETPEERRARKERKREKKARKVAKRSEGLKGVEELLKNLGGSGRPSKRRRSRSRSDSPPARSLSPYHRDSHTRSEEDAPLRPSRPGHNYSRKEAPGEYSRRDRSAERDRYERPSRDYNSQRNRSPPERFRR